jgi:hypothetical protein
MGRPPLCLIATISRRLSDKLLPLWPPLSYDRKEAWRDRIAREPRIVVRSLSF